MVLAQGGRIPSPNGMTHVYFTFGWPWLNNDEREQLVADARFYHDEFAWHTNYPKGEARRPVLLDDLTDDEANDLIELLAPL